MDFTREKQIILEKNHNINSTNILIKRVSSQHEDAPRRAVRPNILFVFWGKDIGNRWLPLDGMSSDFVTFAANRIA